jgi:hypothetical protein
MTSRSIHFIYCKLTFISGILKNYAEVSKYQVVQKTTEENSDSQQESQQLELQKSRMANKKARGKSRALPKVQGLRSY